MINIFYYYFLNNLMMTIFRKIKRIDVTIHDYNFCIKIINFISILLIN